MTPVTPSDVVTYRGLVTRAVVVVVVVVVCTSGVLLYILLLLFYKITVSLSVIDKNPAPLLDFL